MKDLFSLEGKIALVTGGSAGKGAMTAEGFVNSGAKVYLVARREDVLKKKQQELSEIGECEYITTDVSSVEGMKYCGLTPAVSSFRKVRPSADCSIALSTG